MAIEVTCTCGKRLSVKDELAGKRGKCPACGAPLVIPSPAPLASPPPVPNAARPQSAPPAANPAVSPAPPAPTEPKPKSDPFYCPRCNSVLQKTLTTKNIVTQAVLALAAGFYFVPTAPFKCPFCGPVKYHELSPEESRRAQEVISAKGCFKLGCALSLGGLVLTFIVGYVLHLFGVKFK